MARKAADGGQKKKTAKTAAGKKPSAAAPSAHALKVTPDKFKEVLGKVTRAKAEASEASGEAGAAVKDAIDTHGLNKAAFAFTAKLNKMEPVKRYAVLTDLEQMCRLAGFFDQSEMFGDLIRFKGESIASLKQGGAKTPRGGKSESGEAAAPVLDLGKAREKKAAKDAEATAPDPFKPALPVLEKEAPIAG